jgi:hypothetical protein
VLRVLDGSVEAFLDHARDAWPAACAARALLSDENDRAGLAVAAENLPNSRLRSHAPDSRWTPRSRNCANSQRSVRGTSFAALRTVHSMARGDGMTLLALAAVAVASLLIGGIGGVVACGLGRIATETDRADRAAWERRRREA